MLFAIGIWGRVSKKDGEDILIEEENWDYGHSYRQACSTAEDPLEFFYVPGRSFLMYIALIGEIMMIYIYSIVI